ncbi:MAG: hypothetical protein V4538_03105 [Bacteroidota bacterium]
MNKSKFLILVLVFNCFIAKIKSQEILNIKDSLNRKQGEWIDFYDVGCKKIKSRIYYHDNNKDGKAYFYNKVGKLKELVYYKENRIILSKEFYTDNKREGKVKTVNGIKFNPSLSKLRYEIDSSKIKSDKINLTDPSNNKTGIWHEVMFASFFNVPGYSEYYIVGYYLAGSRHGITKYYNYDNHNLKFEANYKNGILDGIFNVYNNDGNIIVMYNYVNGLRDGDYTAFYDNGKIRYKGTMKDDKLFGEYFEYDKKGNCILHIKDVKITPPY